MGRNHPAEAMPFDGMVRRYLIIYIVNLLLLTNECQQRSSTDYALGVAHNTSRILAWVNTTLSIYWLALRPPITRLRNVCHRSGANTIVPSQMAGFGRPMPLARYENCTSNSYVQFPFHLHSRLLCHEHYLSFYSLAGRKSSARDSTWH